MDIGIGYPGKRRDGAGYVARDYRNFEVRVELRDDDKVSVLFIFPDGSAQQCGWLEVTKPVADWLGYALLKYAREGKVTPETIVKVTNDRRVTKSRKPLP